MYFEEPWIAPRTEDHLLALGILPDLPGAYCKDVAHDPCIDGVLISHPHTDHYDDIRWLKDGIPIYMSAAAKAVVLAREYAGHRGPAKEYCFASWTKKEGPEELRSLKAIELDLPKEVAGLTTTAHEVDHSVMGAVGYTVETSAGCVAYTGDFRLHGTRADLSKAFLAAAARQDPVALLIEGTHLADCHVESEEEVRAKLLSIVGETRGLVVAGLAAADADRLATFHHVARATDRTLVLTSKQALMVDRIDRATGKPPVDLGARDILIFRKEKKGSYAYEDYLGDQYQGRVVDAADVKGMQAKVILVASLTDMLALTTIDPVAGSVYILSSSEPFNEEMELSLDRLKEWLTLYGLPLYQVHASGHATAYDLRRAVEIIQPKRVFVVHTENPRLYARFLEKLGFTVVQPAEGMNYEL